MSQEGETVKDTAHASYQRKEDPDMKHTIMDEEAVTFRDDLTKRYNNLPTVVRGERMEKSRMQYPEIPDLFKDE